MEVQSKTPCAEINEKKEGTRRKYRKRRGIKSCLSVFLAAVVTVTTVHSQVLFVQAEDGGDADNKPRSFSFLDPSDYSFEKEIHIEKKGTLEDTIAKLPTSLPVNMQKADDGTGEIPPDVSDGDPTGGTVPGVSDGNPAENAGQDENNKDSTENTPGGTVDGENGGNTSGGTAGGENGENTSGDTAGDENGENTSGDTAGDENGENTSGGTAGGENGENTSGGTVDGENGENSAGPSNDTAGSENGGDASDAASVLPDASLQTIVPDAPVYSAPEGSSAAVMTAPDNDTAGTPGSSDPEATPGEDTVPEENRTPEDVETEDIQKDELPTDETDTVQNDDPTTEETTRQELPVSWSCEHYDDMRDSYLFTATWDSNLFECTGGEIPTITVFFDETPFLVSDEAELRQAFKNLYEVPPENETSVSIVLTNDISLADTLYIPTDWAKNFQITLESKMDNENAPFSLTRGTASDGTTFSGAMLLFGSYPAPGSDVPAPASADSTPGGSLTLTLRNITIDGKKDAYDGTDSSILSTDANKANAPAVITSGNLILESGARIVNNYNGGTYLYENGFPVLDENNAFVYDIPPCGGGIWACGGTLTLQKDCRIQYNTAEQFGGGIYLSSGAVLRCYTEAEALTGNTALSGSGADLYACAGSTIYYDPTVFIPWSSFYLDEATMIPEGGSTPDTTTPVEIYLHVCSDSGYSYQEVKEQIESAFDGRVTVLLPQTYMIDTTDLRNWYVYDHYDTNHWGGASIDGSPVSWQNAYKEYKHRPYYGYTTTMNGTTPVKDNDISAWLENPPYYNADLALSPLNEHIYSTAKNGRPEMSFVGYDREPKVDFLFYDPQSDGQKTVEFDVDSSKVNTHTLAGTGFLLNTGIVGDNKDLLSGYLLYYTYLNTTAKSVSLYKFDNVNIKELHDAKYTAADTNPNAGIHLITSAGNLVERITSEGTYEKSSLPITNWDTEMSIKIKVDENKISLTQHPKSQPVTADNTLTCTWPITSTTGLNSFGPLVAYLPHACYQASSFTYSNLRMQFTNPDDEKNLLSSLAEADFSQQGNVKKYFMNLLGESQKLNYGGDSTGTQLGGQYYEYLYMMQNEGIGLITDAKTGFEEYLGPTKISPNLFEIPNPDKKADLNTLITNLKTYLSMYPTTKLPENPEAAGLTKANAQKPVGNIWLTDMNDQQLRQVINANAISSNYIVNVVDIACDPKNEGYTAEYYLRGPGFDYKKLPLGSETEGEESPVALFSVPGRPSGVSFVITNDPIAWPTGLYTVKQEVTPTNASDPSIIYGYSYFTLTRDPLPVEVPDPIVTSPASSPSGRPEITALTSTPEVLPSDGASQPKTGDGMFPAMPVACGACTAFMMKIMLWMYDMDFDALTELKIDTVQALISWGKGSAKPKIYLAIVALTAVITAYHIVKALYENSRQFVRERFGRA